MKKAILPIVRGGLLGAGMALLTNGIEFGCRAMGIELNFTREDVLVLSLAVVIGFRHWVAGSKAV